MYCISVSSNLWYHWYSNKAVFPPKGVTMAPPPTLLFKSLCTFIYVIHVLVRHTPTLIFFSWEKHCCSDNEIEIHVHIHIHMYMYMCRCLLILTYIHVPVGVDSKYLSCRCTCTLKGYMFLLP